MWESNEEWLDDLDSYSKDDFSNDANKGKPYPWWYKAPRASTPSEKVTNDGHTFLWNKEVNDNDGIGSMSNQTTILTIT